MTPNLYSATIEEDTDSGEMYITLPPALLQSLGWNEDDNLEWTQIDSDRFQLRKIE